MCNFTSLLFQCLHEKDRRDVECHFYRGESVYMSPQQKLTYKCPSPVRGKEQLIMSTECEPCRSAKEALIRSKYGEPGVKKLHTIWRIELIIDWASVIQTEKSIWENASGKSENLDEADIMRFNYVKSEWKRLEDQVPVLNAELKKLRGDLELEKMEIPQAVLERLQGHREIPMSDIVNTSLEDDDYIQESSMEDITNTDE